MKAVKVNIVLLASFHIIVFLAPLTIKEIHNLSIRSNYSNHEKNAAAVSKAEKSCIIFRFETGNLISKDSEKYLHIKDYCDIPSIPPESNSYIIPFLFFAHRAPPVISFIFC